MRVISDTYTLANRVKQRLCSSDGDRHDSRWVTSKSALAHELCHISWTVQLLPNPALHNNSPAMRALVLIVIELLLVAWCPLQAAFKQQLTDLLADVSAEERSAKRLKQENKKAKAR